jgi:predicted nucleic acid-binding protein
MASSKKVKRFVDINILVYSVDLSRENRQKHRAALETIRPNETEILCFSTQILAEFYAVVTSSKSIARPMSPQEAISRMKRFCQMPNTQLLPTPENIMDSWLPLLENHPVKGAGVFDIIHLGTMLACGIRSIYTFNDDDFNWYPDIEVIVPTIQS